MSKAWKKSGKGKKPPLGGSRKRLTWIPAGKDFRSPFGTTEPLRIVVSRGLEWVLPYLEKTHKILPRLHMPISIKGYRPSLKRRLRTLGSSYYDDGIINLATHEQVYDRRNRRVQRIKSIRRLPRRKILETLAHELAHFHVAEHNFEHAEMTRTIFRTFGLRRECPYCDGRGQVEFECNPH